MEFLELTEEEFRNYLNKSEERTFLQTPEIGKLREKSGWTVSYLGVKNKGEVVAAAMFTSITRHFGKKSFMLLEVYYLIIVIKNYLLSSLKI